MESKDLYFLKNSLNALHFSVKKNAFFKRPVYIFAFGVYNYKQVNVSGIQHYLVQMAQIWPGIAHGKY